MRLTLMYFALSILLLISIPSHLNATPCAYDTSGCLIGLDLTLVPAKMLELQQTDMIVSSIHRENKTVYVLRHSIGHDHVSIVKSINWVLTEACLRQVLKPPA